MMSCSLITGALYLINLFVISIPQGRSKASGLPIL